MKKNKISINNKVILITGAFGLIGKRISNFFLGCGAKVILAGHNKNSISKIEEELIKDFDSSKFLVTTVELEEENSITACLEISLKKFKRIDVLINNAAIDAKYDKYNKEKINQNRFENYPFELIKKSVNINLLGTVMMTQKIIQQMLKQSKGNIINVASTYSLLSPNHELYNFGEKDHQYKPIDYIVSKSFLPNFTRYIATLYAKNNIRCNAIAPHGIFNNHDDAFIANFKKLSPMQRMARIDEMDSPFLFLASDASSYITGITLLVDGGWTAW